MKPILYSFRRCPYCIRARHALHQADIDVEHREIDIKNKPAHMLQISPKGTVPVLLLPGGKVIDESLHIMFWAMEKNDPEGWLAQPKDEIIDFVRRCDATFAKAVTRYKYPDRHPDVTLETSRNQALEFLMPIEAHIFETGFVLGSSMSLADIAILPLIRQFAMVDEEWFESQESLKATRSWLVKLTKTLLFEKVMERHDVWEEK